MIYAQCTVQLVVLLSCFIFIFTDENSPKVAAMYYFGQDVEAPLTEYSTRRLAYLHCSLSKLYGNIGHTTSIDAIVWVLPQHESRIPEWLTIEFPRLQIIALNVTELTIPIVKFKPIINSDLAVTYSWEYFMMGRFRLITAMEYARYHGYSYVLQLDDDTMIMDQIPVDLGLYFKQNNLKWGVRRRYFTEKDEYVLGAAEFTKFWLTIRHKTKVEGALYAHVDPPSLATLSTETWDKQQYAGCFQMIDVEFWFREDVQDYVSTLLATGADITQRWLDQVVQNFVRLLFVPENQVHYFPDTEIIHSKFPLSLMGELGCSRSPAVVQVDVSAGVRRAGSATSLQFPIQFSGNHYLDHLFFDWLCESYEQFTDSCAEAPEASLQLYIAGLCVAKYFSAAECEMVTNYALYRWQLVRHLPPYSE